MRRIGPDAWAGLVMLLLCVAVGTPTLLIGTGMRVPRPVWISLFVALLIALLIVAMWEHLRPGLARVCYGLAVVLGWVTVLTAPNAGWLPILLVFTATMSAYFLPLWTSALVIALNSVVIALAMGGDGAGLAGAAAGTLFYLLIQVATVLSTSVTIKEQRMRRELTEAHIKLRAASVVLADTTRAHERLRISRELHDLIGHQLTALTLELEVARHQEGPAAREHVERANHVARDLLDNVRETVGQLRAGAPDLRESLSSVVRDIPGLDIDVRVDEDVQTAEEQTMTLIRVVQEIVTNTVRHADATMLRIDIERRPDGTVQLTSVDDGRGAPCITPGNGLRGLVERIDAMGGDVRLDGSDGFRVTAWMPAR